MFSQVSLIALFAAIFVCFVSANPAEQSAKQPANPAAAGDRNKRGLYASPYLASPYVASPYVASPYVASPYVASRYIAASPYVSSPYVASPYVASHYPYGAVSSYATYPYVAKTFSSPYAYYPWGRGTPDASNHVTTYQMYVTKCQRACNVFKHGFITRDFFVKKITQFYLNKTNTQILSKW